MKPNLDRKLNKMNRMTNRMKMKARISTYNLTHIAMDKITILTIKTKMMLVMSLFSWIENRDLYV